MKSDLFLDLSYSAIKNTSHWDKKNDISSYFEATFNLIFYRVYFVHEYELQSCKNEFWKTLNALLAEDAIIMLWMDLRCCLTVVLLTILGKIISGPGLVISDFFSQYTMNRIIIKSNKTPSMLIIIMILSTPVMSMHRDWSCLFDSTICLVLCYGDGGF